ncbi:XrtA-associated tyrosine autokinase [Kordiimonas sp. SCSIO 12610]|uniref:XrtA-associated tyrosine autokinase n=1 Tax=Kordiimonas sp. SCSIO 12610 TaxID=2829597 RepID=UPI00210EA620|nr:XrtA-associated tyrosine autokinase [Kordiimonas sp. SCSIO 12610]UTW54155.1 XrtA-associated tyrosine autokinase [Kordiimonas sp. SCSIO 12610]
MTDKREEKKASLLERAAENLEKPSSLKQVSEKPDPSALSTDANTNDDLSSFRGLSGSGAKNAQQVSPQPDENADDASDVDNDAVTKDKTAQKAEADPQKSSNDQAKSKAQDIDLLALRDAGFITPDMPPNLMSEEFRIIKRSILLNAFAKGNEDKKNSNIVLVTSSSPGEGKTFSAINLALSIATEQDVTVLLVDADFSKPEVLNRLGVAGGKGLMDAVADKEVDLGDCLVRTSIPNLVLLPAGRQHNLTTELLASDRMEKMVNELSSRYNDRIIIFDSPPVLASSAASVLALYMGQTVFVIEAEKTTEPQIKESLNMISACENINLVLNKTHYSGSNKKFASYYGYGGR